MALIQARARIKVLEKRIVRINRAWRRLINAERESNLLKRLELLEKFARLIEKANKERNKDAGF